MIKFILSPILYDRFPMEVLLPLELSYEKKTSVPIIMPNEEVFYVESYEKFKSFIVPFIQMFHSEDKKRKSLFIENFLIGKKELGSSCDDIPAIRKYKEDRNAILMVEVNRKKSQVVENP